MTGDRAAVEVSREIAEVKEWLEGSRETGSQFKLTWCFLFVLVGLKGKVMQSRYGVNLLGPWKSPQPLAWPIFLEILDSSYVQRLYCSRFLSYCIIL